jgi:MazG family protein
MPDIEKSEYARKAGDAFADLIATVELLRNPGGCPWDAEQTHLSLRQHLLEETYELLDAIDSGNSGDIEEELGDVMTHMAFHSDIARREGNFDAVSIAQKVQQKLVRRHPHVFTDDERLTDSEDVVDRWEKLKREESGRTSAVASLPAAMPALALSGSIQRRTIKAGLPWPPDRTEEPIFERQDNESDEQAEERAAHLLMKIAREVRQAGVDPEIALRTAAVALRDRVLRAEKQANGVPLADLEPATRENLWTQAALD